MSPSGSNSASSIPGGTESLAKQASISSRMISSEIGVGLPLSE
ncbi:hypothetical protein Tco_0609713, partial [Tanacetum coccineum]